MKCCDNNALAHDKWLAMHLTTVVRFAAITLCVGTTACGPRPVELGFWFEPVTFTSPRLGAPISANELAAIETLARVEIEIAFQDFDVTVHR